MQWMITRFAVLACVMNFLAEVHAQTPQQVENAYAFSRLYGYVRFFHPSDEAASIDWNRFAIYGSARVRDSNPNHEEREVNIPISR